MFCNFAFINFKQTEIQHDMINIEKRFLSSHSVDEEQGEEEKELPSQSEA